MSAAGRCPRCGAEFAGEACPSCIPATEAALLGRLNETWSTQAGTLGPSVLESIANTYHVRANVELRATERDTPPPTRDHALPLPGRTDRSGRYELLGEIARGGMGVVLRGRDTDLKRDLAVKVLLDRHVDHPGLIQRFVEEAQIGGQLQHPGIVPVYELGTFPDNRPFFTMKLVKGRTLADLLSARTSLVDDLPRFVSIFEAVCQTLAYAHARGVIHRDLKPSNVMVGNFGEVQVMDWGLAKVLEPASQPDATREPGAPPPPRTESIIATERSSGSSQELSQAGSVMGTPAYMAPEQARGEVEWLDERSDVFGLGAILCEILTGKPPYVGLRGSEVQRMAAAADLDDAFARIDASGADAELVSLARSCLAPHMRDRPRDANDVARTVRAYLSGVQDRLRRAELERVEAQARAAEERKRRRLQLGLASTLLALTVLCSVGVASWMHLRQARAARMAVALNEVGWLRDQAVAKPDDTARWETAELGVEAAARVLAEGALPDQLARLDAIRREVAQGRASALRDRALLSTVDEIRASKDDLGLEAADSAYARAFQVAGLEVDKGDPASVGERIRARPASFALGAAAALDDWSLVRSALHRPDAEWTRPLAVASAADPDPYRVKLRAAVREPDRDERATSLRDLARAPEAASLPPPSAVLLAQFLRGAGDVNAGVGLLRRVSARHPGDLWVNYVLASHLQELRPSPREEAVRYFSMARAVHPETAHELAHLLDAMGRSDEALGVLEDLTVRAPKRARHLSCLGELLVSLDRKDEARPILERAVAVAKVEIQADPDLSDIRNNLGLALTALGDLKEAAEAFREAIRVNPRNSLGHRNLARVLNLMGDHAAAATAAREAIRLDPRFTDARVILTWILCNQKKHAEAVDVAKDAIQHDPNDAFAHNNLGFAYKGLGRFDEAADAFREAIRRKPDHFQAHSNLADVLDHQGKHAAAVVEHKEAVRLSPNNASIRVNYSKGLLATGDSKGASEQARKAIELDPSFAMAHNNLGVALNNLGKPEEALAEYRRAVRLDPELALAQRNMGYLFMDRGDWNAAVHAWRESLRIEPEVADAHERLGFALLQLELVDEAIEEFERALKLNPSFLRARLNLALARGKKGGQPKGTDALRRAVEKAPNDPSARLALAEALRGTKDWKGAAAEYRRLTQLQPEDAEHHLWLGICLNELEDDPAAAVALEEAARRAPENLQVKAALGLVLYALGRHEEAARLLRVVLDANPKIAGLHCALALCLIAQTDLARRRAERDEALSHARLAVELDANEPAHHSTLAIAELRCSNLAAARREVNLAIEKKRDNPGDWFILAMLEHLEGKPASARATFVKARNMLLALEPDDVNFRILADEAAALLGLPINGELPADPFAPAR